MKNKTTRGRLFIRSAAVVLALSALFIPRTQLSGALATGELLEKALYAEETKGELGEAIALYVQIVSQPGVDRDVAAQAQLRLGLCYLKQGQKPNALAALEKLTRDFPDKEKLLGVVGKQMPLALDEILRQIEQNYVREIDRRELVDSAIKAILGKLDDQSDFIVGRDLQMIDQQIKQQLGGIGAQLKFDAATKEVSVVTPLPGSPAFKGGLRPGDRIIEIDGKRVTDFPEGKELTTAVASLQGKPGDRVTVGIRHEGANKIEQIALVRDTIHLASVKGVHYRADGTWEHMLDKNTGYVRLTQIGKESPAEIELALRELIDRGLKALVLDLRDAPGGLLKESTEICDLFLEEGLIVTVRSRDKAAETYTAKKENTLPPVPVVVLVNRFTASAAEIIAACLQDHQRAVVVGERTFGQGLVKSMIRLEHGAALKLPTGAYFRPSGKVMHRFPESKEEDDWGVLPNAGYELGFSEDELKQYRDAMHARDVLGQVEPQRVAFADRQLDKALEYLRTQVAPR